MESSHTVNSDREPPLVRDVPSGALRVECIHAHSGGSSLSLADLRLLSRVEQITAITRQARYTARRGTNYSTLESAYEEIRGRVVSA